MVDGGDDDGALLVEIGLASWSREWDGRIDANRRVTTESGTMKMGFKVGVSAEGLLRYIGKRRMVHF